MGRRVPRGTQEGGPTFQWDQGGECHTQFTVLYSEVVRNIIVCSINTRRGDRNQNAHHTPAAEEHDLVEHVQHAGGRLVDGHRHGAVPLAHRGQGLGDREGRGGVCAFPLG